MAAIPNPPLITANGTYDIPVTKGQAHLFTLKGTFGGATFALTSLSNGVPGTFDTITDASWTAATETNIRPPSKLLRLSVTNASGTTAVSVTLIPHIN
jgi:hypothetical protein